MARLRGLLVGGMVEDNPLLAAATTMTSAGCAALPVVTSPDYLTITFDPDGTEGPPFIRYVTAHASGSTTATITAAGQEGTTARDVSRDVYWVHAPTPKDFDNLIGLTTYAPATDTSYPITSSGAFVDVDSNMAVTFVAPQSGKVKVVLEISSYSSGNFDTYFSVREATTDVKTVLVGSSYRRAPVSLYITGLTPGSSHTYKLGARAASTWTVYAGPGYGQCIMEVWAVNV